MYLCLFLIVVHEASLKSIVFPLNVTSPCKDIDESAEYLTSWLPNSIDIQYEPKLLHLSNESDVCRTVEVRYIPKAAIDIFQSQNICDVLILYSGKTK